MQLDCDASGSRGPVNVSPNGLQSITSGTGRLHSSNFHGFRGFQRARAWLNWNLGDSAMARVLAVRPQVLRSAPGLFRCKPTEDPRRTTRLPAEQTERKRFTGGDATE